MVKSPGKVGRALSVTLLHCSTAPLLGDATRLTCCQHQITQPTLYLFLNTHCFIKYISSNSPLWLLSLLMLTWYHLLQWTGAELRLSYLPVTFHLLRPKGGYVCNLYSTFYSLILFPSSVAFSSNSKPADNSIEPLKSNWHTHYSTITALLFTCITIHELHRN